MRLHTLTTKGTTVFHAPAETYATCGKQAHKLPEQYIAGLELEFGWSDIDKAKVITLWRRGKGYQSIADAVRRKEIEVRVLVWDLLEAGVISEKRFSLPTPSR